MLPSAAATAATAQEPLVLQEQQHRHPEDGGAQAALQQQWEEPWGPTDTAPYSGQDEGPGAGSGQGEYDWYLATDGQYYPTGSDSSQHQQQQAIGQYPYPYPYPSHTYTVSSPHFVPAPAQQPWMEGGGASVPMMQPQGYYHYPSQPVYAYHTPLMSPAMGPPPGVLASGAYFPHYPHGDAYTLPVVYVLLWRHDCRGAPSALSQSLQRPSSPLSHACLHAGLPCTDRWGVREALLPLLLALCRYPGSSPADYPQPSGVCPAYGAEHTQQSGAYYAHAWGTDESGDHAAAAGADSTASLTGAGQGQGTASPPAPVARSRMVPTAGPGDGWPGSRPHTATASPATLQGPVQRGPGRVEDREGEGSEGDGDGDGSETAGAGGTGSEDEGEDGFIAPALHQGGMFSGLQGAPARVWPPGSASVPVTPLVLQTLAFSGAEQENT
jgi:hypothetical protein